MLRTPRNGGNASLKEVAEAWKKESANSIQWSQSEHDHWAVGFAKQILAELQQAGPAKPDPRNVHQD